jgi:hypothetical protein
LTDVTRNSSILGHCIIPTGNISTDFIPAIALCSHLATRIWPCDGLPRGAFQIFLKRAGLTAATQCRFPPLSFSAHQTHHYYHTAKRAFPDQRIHTPITTPRFGTGRSITLINLGGFNGRSGNASCLPFLAQYNVEVRTIALSSTSLSLIYFFENADSRSRRKEVPNLLLRTSCANQPLQNYKLLWWFLLWPASIYLSIHAGTLPWRCSPGKRSSLSELSNLLFWT